VILKVIVTVGHCCDSDCSPAKSEKAGYAPDLLIQPELDQGVEGSAGTGGPAVALGDAAPLIKQDRLNAAFRETEAGAPFLALAANRPFRDTDGELIPDAGVFGHDCQNAGLRGQYRPSPVF
jgi:hypothetical protein